MNAHTKNSLDLLIKTYEMAQEIIGAETVDAAMLATVVQMARDGNDEMTLYMLHHLNPAVLKFDEVMKSEATEERNDILDLLTEILLS